MSPEVLRVLRPLVYAITFFGLVVVTLGMLFPSTRTALASWIHRRDALSDEAYAELSQMRHEIALLRNEVAELRSLLPGVGTALPSSSATGRLPGGR